MGVRFVLLPLNVEVNSFGAPDEARLLRSGRSGLVPVFESADSRVYELPNAVPLLSGPAPAKLLAFSHVRIEGHVAAAGTYTLRLRSMPYWEVTRGAVCLEPAPNSMTRLVARAAGTFVLEVGTPFDRGRARC
jgi:hypothetical protein